MVDIQCAAAAIRRGKQEEDRKKPQDENIMVCPWGDHKKSPSAHHRTTNLSGYILANKACIDNQKKNSFNDNSSSICPYNTLNFGPLTAEICWRVWGTPANFNAPSHNFVGLYLRN